MGWWVSPGRCSVVVKNRGSEVKAAVRLGQPSVISVCLSFLTGQMGNNKSTDLKEELKIKWEFV